MKELYVELSLFIYSTRALTVSKGLCQVLWCRDSNEKRVVMLRLEASVLYMCLMYRVGDAWRPQGVPSEVQGTATGGQHVRKRQHLNSSSFWQLFPLSPQPFLGRRLNRQTMLYQFRGPGCFSGFPSCLAPFESSSPFFISKFLQGHLFSSEIPCNLTAVPSFFQ